MAVDNAVQPRRQRTNADRYVIAVDTAQGTYVSEQTGEIGTLADLALELMATPSAIVACDNSAALLENLHSRHHQNPAWRYRVSPLERDIYSPKPTKIKARQIGLTVSYFGWAYSKKSNRNQRDLFHMAIDPLTFSGISPRKTANDLTGLLEWGKSIRDFCLKNLLDLRPTQGSTARQFLRDPRFYPEPRRKVPRSTNDKARPTMPGGYFKARIYPREATRKGPPKFTAYYVDQSRAHHYHAMNETLPDANRLYAMGNFAAPDRPWKTNQQRIAHFLESFSGLLAGTLEGTPQGLRWAPDELQHGGRTVYFYSNELPLFHSLGVTVRTINAAWGSHKKHKDTGLSRYGEWAIEELAAGDPPWKKSLLLATYGVLATRPRDTFRFGFQPDGTEEPTILRVGGGTVPARLRTIPIGEPGVNNVIHRGMIEAATRAESLLYANYLRSKGWRTLVVYADAVIVQTRQGLELATLPPWRIKRTLTNLQILSHNAFTSDQMTKVPGGQSQDVYKGYIPADHKRHAALFGTRHQTYRHPAHLQP